MKEKRFTLKALILTILATVIFTVALVVLAAWLRLGSGGLAVLQAAELVQSRFVGDYDEQTLADGALNGLADSLGDRWSYYLTAEEYSALIQRRKNTYVGIGLTYTRLEDQSGLEVVDVTAGAPAEQAGILPGEIIRCIDGIAITPKTLQELVASISGEAGQELSLTVEDLRGECREVTLVREDIEQEPVEYQLLENGVGYVRLKNFYQRSADSVEAAVKALKEQGAKALLFDVRNNPGGYVDQLTQMLDALLPEGAIFTERSKNGAVRVVESDADWAELPMAVLVNGDSYSAAELFAAQLKESVDAPIIGTQTCGKGYYQQALELVNDGALNLSTGVYTTGSGRSLIGTGLTPDVVEEDAQKQLEKALERLEEIMK